VAEAGGIGVAENDSKQCCTDCSSFVPELGRLKSGGVGIGPAYSGRPRQTSCYDCWVVSCEGRQDEAMSGPDLSFRAGNI